MQSRPATRPTRLRPLMKPLPLLLAILLALPADAADFTTKSPDAPRIPAHEFSASSLGVAPGSGAPVTDALQKAIDHVANQGGGKLTLAPGEYLVGPVRLGSHLDLHLESGAVLRLLPLADYPTSSSGGYLNFLSASAATDLIISGEGKIDGQGEAWWPAFRSKEIARRPQIIALENCERVELTGFTVQNPPNSHLALRLCRDVVLRNLKLEAPGDSPNTDGINISGKNYLITGCRVSTGDDNIAIRTTTSAKGWSSPMCENFVIRDCTFGAGHGLSIGSYTTGGIRNILVEHCTFDGTTAGIRLKADRDRGGLVENLTYRDITMRGVKNPLFLTSYYPRTPKSPEDDAPRPITETTPRWQKILIENLTVTDSVNSIIFWGLPEMPLGEITLRNARFTTEKGARLYHAPHVILDRVSVHPASGEPFDIRPAPSTSSKTP